MNITESTDVQLLLAWILGTHDIADDVAKHRAFHLAERARSTLGAGPTGAEVAALWRQRRPIVIRDTTDAPAPELRAVDVGEVPDA